MITPEQMKRSMLNRLETKRTILMWLVAIISAAYVIFTIYQYAILNKRAIEGQAATVKTQKQIIEYTVKANDTIDKLAKRYYSDTHLLEARADIKKLNNMKTCDIYEGQVILLEKGVN